MTIDALNQIFILFILFATFLPIRRLASLRDDLAEKRTRDVLDSSLTSRFHSWKIPTVMKNDLKLWNFDN